MTTQSMAPSNSMVEKPQNQTTEVEAPTKQESQDAKAAGSKLNSATSVFVNSEPVREEQVQNAMKFLSHPKVRGSPVIYRRSFLEKKGLTKEEIDEAFRRVPDPPSSAQTPSMNQDGQAKSSLNVQPQVQMQTPKPAVLAPAGVMSSSGILAWYRFHWSHAFLAVGVLAASGAGTVILLKKSIVPRLKCWIRKIVMEEDNVIPKQIDSKPSLVEEAAAAAKATAAAAADVAKASQEMLIVRTEERRYFEEFMNLIELQVLEMKNMSKTVKKLEERSHFAGQEDHRISVTGSKKLNVNGREDFDLRSVRSSSPSASVEPAAAPHSKSYMDIMAMVQRGEKPPNIREINDLPPNPNQQPSNPRLAPRTKPWEVGQPQSSIPVFPSQVMGGGLNAKAQDNALSYQSNGNSPVPWWQRKNDRIVELGSEDEIMSGSYMAQATEQPPPPVQRTWVPPQPPPVAMPEAAEAIRRPKPSVQNEQLADDQSVAHPANVSDELQRITKISESAGLVEINGGSSELNSGEIQEEHQYNQERNGR